MKLPRIASASLVFALAVAPRASASAIVLYGDEDGFGVGATTSVSPELDNATPADPSGTDVRLIGGGFGGPPFAPVGPVVFAPQSGITSIVLTMSMGGFGGNSDPVDGPNAIVLDGLALSNAFLDSFGAVADDAPSNIVTRSLVLPSAFHALFADGIVSLGGTYISEQLFAGSFQVDYLRFDITSRDVPPVPEPTSLLLIGTSVAGLVLRRRRS